MISSTRKKQIIASILVLVGIPAAFYFFFLRPALDCDTSYDPNACYFSEATDKNNLKLCDKITEPSSKGSCYGAILAKKNDHEKCATLREQEAKDACYFAVASDNRNKELCDKISIESDNTTPVTPYTRNNCYLRTVSKNTPPTDCENFESIKDKDVCYEDIGRANNDANSCEKISNPYRKGDCYNSVARETNNYTLCPFSSTGDINHCYLVVGGNTKNASVCELIKGDTSLWNNCFITVARKTKKIELCDKLLNDESRQICRTELTR